MAIATQIPENVFQHITKNAGVIANAFNTTTGTLNRADIIGATKGGITFTDKPTYTDNGEDVDNMPKGMMEMMELDSREINCSGTFVSVTQHTIKDLTGPADETASSASNPGKVTPRNELKVSDFKKSLWFITDYGKGGWIAIRMDNVLNEDGLSIKSTDKQKGEYAFNFKAHYSSANPDTVPYEIFIKEGTAASGSSGTPHDDANKTT